MLSCFTSSFVLRFFDGFLFDHGGNESIVLIKLRAFCFFLTAKWIADNQASIFPHKTQQMQPFVCQNGARTKSSGLLAPVTLILASPIYGSVRNTFTTLANFGCSWPGTSRHNTIPYQLLLDFFLPVDVGGRPVICCRNCLFCSLSCFHLVSARQFFHLPFLENRPWWKQWIIIGTSGVQPLHGWKSF